MITGGGGSDTVTIVANSNRGTYATLTDAAAGDVINFANNRTETFASTKIALASTSTFADYLDQAAANAFGATNANVTWFQYSGDTYIVVDNSDTTTFVVGTDMILKLTGLIDLKNSIIGDHILTLV